MKKFFYIALITVLASSTYMVMRPSTIKVEAFRVQRGSFEETFSADGKIRCRDRQIVYAQGAGEISNLTIKVGDLVTRGQVVGTLDSNYIWRIKIPRDGVITKVLRDSSGPVVRGEALFEVSSVDDLEIIAEVLTPDAVRLNVNGEAQVQNWGGDYDLAAKVIQISKAGMIKISALGVEEEKVEVKLNFLKTPLALENKLGDNYHVDVLFLISRDDNVLSIPLGALFKNGEKWAVYMIQEGRAYLREVQIDKKNDRFAKLTLGLSEGDLVILFPGDKIQEGTRVRIE